MRVFVFEYLTAAGIGRDPADPQHSMYREGRAMRDAVAADFRHFATVDVQECDDPATVERGFARAATQADFTLVIAPETDGWLERFTSCLGSTVETVRLTADKLALAHHWRTHGVRTPATTDREPTACEAFPLVWKPRDGAGSTETYRLQNNLDVARVRDSHRNEGPMILQEFVPGQPASLAFLCGPAGNVPLLPTFQHLSDDGRFHYLGGELPIPAPLAERAVRLGQRAVQCVPGLRGWIGVDLVLGDAADGSRDFAIEINPRLTTSYVGLRALAGFNLAEALLKVATGEPPPPILWKPGRVRFTSDGTVSPLAGVPKELG